MVVIRESEIKDLGYVVRGCETEVGPHFGSIDRFRMRVVLGPFCLFLSDEGYGVRSTSRTPDRVQHARGSTHIEF